MVDLLDFDNVMVYIYYVSMRKSVRYNCIRNLITGGFL